MRSQYATVKMRNDSFGGNLLCRARVINNARLSAIVVATPNYSQLIVVSAIVVQFTAIRRPRYSRYGLVSKRFKATITPSTRGIANIYIGGPP